MPDKPSHCRSCNASFNSQRELEEHNQKAHHQQGTSPKERKESDM